MNKDAKATEYRIEPLVKLLRSEAISDGGTEKKAATLEGKWIKLNEYEYVLEEAGSVTRVYIDTVNVGCACGRCNNNLMCEHIIAFEALESPPQLTIESPDYRWLREYLFGLGWYSENGYLYPSLDAEVTESATLDPVHEDHDLDIGIVEEPEPKKYSRKCAFCGEINATKSEKGADEWLVWHESICQKNPENKKKESPRLVTQEVKEAQANVPEIPEGSDDARTVAKSETVEKPKQAPVVREYQTTEKPKVEKPQKEGNKVKTNTAVTKQEKKTPAVRKEMPTEADFQRVKVERLMKSQGSIYKVSGKEVADSAAVSSYAVSAGVSTETTMLEQTSEYARATVRAYKGGRYTEGSVLIRRDAILEKIMIDLAEKNPEWIIGWSNGLPEFDLNQKVFIGDKRKILGLHIAGVVADKWMFASRDCETKAGRRAQIKMLGSDWREDDEVESEVEEMNTVAKR